MVAEVVWKFTVQRQWTMEGMINECETPADIVTGARLLNMTQPQPATSKPGLAINDQKQLDTIHICCYEKQQ